MPPPMGAGLKAQQRHDNSLQDPERCPRCEGLHQKTHNRKLARRLHERGNVVGEEEIHHGEAEDEDEDHHEEGHAELVHAAGEPGALRGGRRRGGALGGLVGGAPLVALRGRLDGYISSSPRTPSPSTSRVGNS